MKAVEDTANRSMKMAGYSMKEKKDGSARGSSEQGRLWQSVRDRISRIEMDLQRIEQSIQDEKTEAEVIKRLSAMRDKFETVMHQLSQFDEASESPDAFVEECIHGAKEDFARVVERYQDSRAGALGEEDSSETASRTGSVTPESGRVH